MFSCVYMCMGLRPRTVHGLLFLIMRVLCLEIMDLTLLMRYN